MLIAPSSPNNLSISDVFFFFGAVDSVVSIASLVFSSVVAHSDSDLFVDCFRGFFPGPNSKKNIVKISLLRPKQKTVTEIE